MALPTEGWTSAPMRAGVTPFPLPAAEVFDYFDPGELAEVGVAVEHVARTIGLASVSANAGRTAGGQSSVRGRISIGGIYSVALLDSLTLPPAFDQCITPAGSSFDQCAGPAAGAWWACN